VRLGFPSAYVQSHFSDEQLGHYHIDAIDARQIHSGDALHFQRIRDSRCVTATLTTAIVGCVARRARGRRSRMESTAQYLKPVWGALERYWKPMCEKREGARPKSGTLHLAQAQSNRGRRGRKRDFVDAERLP